MDYLDREEVEGESIVPRIEPEQDLELEAGQSHLFTPPLLIPPLGQCSQLNITSRLDQLDPAFF